MADARVEEGTDGATLDFVVSLSRVASGTVTVAYETSEGSAKAGSDYTHTEGTLTFAAGETEKTVPVPVIDDEHDENEETLTLTLSNPSGAWIEDGEATGTIENSDPMPKAWLARFGRTVSEQVLEAVSDRLSAPREAGFRARLGGQELSFGGAGVEAEPSPVEEADAGARLGTLAGWLEGEDGAEHRDGAGGFATPTLSGRELLLGSAFSLTGGTAESGQFAAWGRAAVSGIRRSRRRAHARRRGDHGHARGGLRSAVRWQAGLVLSVSRGEGGYRSPSADGEVSSTLTALHPWAGLDVSERLSLWAATGYGSGDPGAPARGDGRRRCPAR